MIKNEEIYDTIIIGAGSAGCSAGIYATRYNLNTLILAGHMPGGLISEALEVENYPGYKQVNGMELANKFVDQAISLGAKYEIEIVRSAVFDDDTKLFKVVTDDNEYVTKSVILAMGTKHKKLNVAGEAEFAGKGVSYCATCDGPFFKNKTVVVAGGGNSAVEGAQEIAIHAKNVYLIARSELKAAPIYIDNLRKNPKIVEISGTNIKNIIGDKNVTAVEIDIEYQNSTVIPTDGVFIQIGYEPINDIATKLGVALSAHGYVKVDAGMGTNIKGVFCAGDLNNASNMFHQQVTSAGEGAIAAQSAYRHLQGIDYLITEI